MIPIKLSFQAFGPYVKKQEIEFDKFENSGVFLIHGITGSGKTTILDAITYALYGKSSGGNRGDITAMRCQMAKEEIPTEVEFIFKISEKTYKFTRNIIIKTKRNGSKDYNVAQNAMFLNKDGIFVPFFENPKIKDVEQKSCEIIGLNHEQFIQVIMLPQGKFEKLLVAKSDEKEEILVTLFNAKKWQEAAEWICNEARNISKDVVLKRENINVMLKSENAETKEDLETKISNLTESIENITKEKFKSEELLKDEKIKLELQNDTFNLFEEKSRTEKELKKIIEQQEKTDILSAKLEKGRKALNVEQKYTYVINVQRKFNESKEKLEKEQKNNAICIDIKDKTEKSLQELKKNEEYIEKLKENKIKAEGLTEVYSQITSSKTDADKQNKKYEDLRNEELNKQKLLNSTKEKLQKYSQMKDFIFNNYSLKLPELKEKAEKFNMMDKKTAEVQIIQTEINKANNALNVLKKDLEECKNSFVLQKKEYDSLYGKYIGQAAFLISEELEDGKKCPVCGSIHHPEKASKSDSNVDSSQINDLRVALDKLNENSMELNNIIAKQDAAKTSKSEKMQELQNEINELSKNLNSYSKENIYTCLKKAESEINKLQEIIATETKLTAQTSKLEGELILINNDLSVQSKLKEESQAKYNSLSERKIDGIESEADLINKINDFAAKINDYSNKLISITEQYNNADKKLSSSNTSLMYLKEQTDKLCDEYNEAKSEYIEILKSNNFADTEEFKSNLVNQDILDDWDKQIQNYIIEKGSVAKNLERLEFLTKNKTKPNLDAIKNAVSSLEKNITEHEKQIALHTDGKNRLETIIRKVSKEQKILQELMHKYDTYYNFGITLRGDKGISLRRYVLGVMLTSVTVEANRLLKNVHDGRYQLCRTLEGSGRSRKAGLELEVFDGYSGEKRGVAGLSGGEKFLVSLALSLGLSSVVQSQSGGIKIDTMFIDEGFGSLDSSSIADALNILSSVKGSKRLVGIISHVQLLKETVEASITVQKDRNGSFLIINS
ncbi:MAG: SbcC/MukB-like Walker B domain-containing protein [Sedimentibacter sp.]|uniref:SbcC/MukB-like Walker B domain-containing protein n=1 Tax=Sedimentibacter sp. TaxID=1960295 RepID=UPI0029824498|nr:SbcC/MukB-like Walker B domain-containing protein [Sedimentibacter sp.]MDW5299662.1 SbcC/MukB-like Walker B domain-containing protein [Sedimentibacter sp.]